MTEGGGTGLRAADVGASVAPAIDAPVRWVAADGAAARREAARACRRRALLLWPRLDPERLARTRGDPWRIARLVARRTPRPLDEIVAMLTIGAPACPLYAVEPVRSHLAGAALGAR